MILKNAFTTIINLHDEHNQAEKLWQEISNAYSHKKRYYHNFQHLENMYTELMVYKSLIADWNTIVLSLIYHDIIYKATAKDNE